MPHVVLTWDKDEVEKQLLAAAGKPLIAWEWSEDATIKSPDGKLTGETKILTLHFPDGITARVSPRWLTVKGD